MRSSIQVKFDNVSVIVPSAAPASPNLADASDSGSFIDGQHHQSQQLHACSSLQFTIDGTSNGSTITIYADGTPIGSAIAQWIERGRSRQTAPTTLSDGAQLITASQVGKRQDAFANLLVAADHDRHGCAVGEQPGLCICNRSRACSSVL
jgi:hypothetical protein